MNLEARKIVSTLRLTPLPREGGLFRQTWRSEAGSAIYFLLTPDNFSALHRLRIDEIWHFYAGDPVEHVQLDPRGGTLRQTRLGQNALGGDTPQLAVPSGVWQGARIAVNLEPVGRGLSPTGRAGREVSGIKPDLQRLHGWALLGCTLAPPWDERDFELGARAALLRDFPEHAAIVHAWTR